MSTDSIWIVFQPWKTVFHKPLLHMERWYFCDHQTAFQSFLLHLTAVTNFLYPLRLHRVFPDSLDSFPAMENFLPLTTNAFHKWKGGISMTTRQLISVISTTSNRGYKPTNFLCPLQWNRVSTDSIWIVFHPWKTPFHKPLPHMERKGGISVTTRQLLSHFHCI